MESIHGPVIVRPGVATKPREAPYFIKPGLHSHNAKRRIRNSSLTLGLLGNVRVLLLVIGVCGIGYYGYSLSDQYVYQRYQNWAFDQQIGGRAAVTFADYLREKTPFGFLAGAERSRPSAHETGSQPQLSPEISRPPQGSLLGRVSIERLSLSAMVREGVDANTLKLAVGHVPSTALPGQSGNFAIAAHRDTLFRALKDIERGDIVTFQAPDRSYKYQVISTKIVKPSDISVLRADGGWMTPAADSSAAAGQASDKLLTMITCYPFYYVGAAPKRFIVQAQMVSTGPASPLPSAEERNISSPARIPATLRKAPKTRRSSHLLASRRAASVYQSHEPLRKRNFWHKLFHAS